jgi:uncharacterized protein (DUF433 family)
MMMDHELAFQQLKDSHKPMIVSNPDIRGGEPCFAGTRIPVAAIIACLAGGDDPEDIYDSYPSLPLGGVEAAIEWDTQQRRAA